MRIESDRDLTFDIMKGMAAYCVVWGHLLSQGAGKKITLISLFHMPVFFWVGGYFLYNSLIRHQKQGGGVLAAFNSQGIAVVFAICILVSGIFFCKCCTDRFAAWISHVARLSVG